MHHTDEKDLYGLDGNNDLNEQPEVDAIGPKASKKLVAAVIVIVMVVLTPLVMYTTTKDDGANKKKAKEEMEKKRIDDIKIPQSLDAVNNEVGAQEVAGQKQAAAQQSASAAASATSSDKTVNNVPLPGPLSPEQMKSFNNPEPSSNGEDVKKDTERKHMVEIAGSSILVINKGGQDGTRSPVASIDSLIAKLGSSQQSGLSPTEKAKAETEKALAEFNAQNPGETQQHRDENKQWLNDTASSSGDGAQVINPQKPISKYTIFQGSLIPAVLISEINSDLPGQITAQVSQNVYDGINGKVMLIPKGSKLVGAYNNGIKAGQARVMAAFTRLIYPSGVSVPLGAMQAADGLGRSGMGGDVDNHFWKMFNASFLIAGLSAILQNNSPPSATVVTTSGQGQPLMNAAGQVLVDTSKVILDRNKSVQPTITVPSGFKFNIVVQKDMILPPSITSQRPMY